MGPISVFFNKFLFNYMIIKINDCSKTIKTKLRKKNGYDGLYKRTLVRKQCKIQMEFNKIKSKKNLNKSKNFLYKKHLIYRFRRLTHMAYKNKRPRNYACNYRPTCLPFVVFTWLKRANDTSPSLFLKIYQTSHYLLVKIRPPKCLQS